MVLNIDCNCPSRGCDRTTLRYNKADGFVGRDTDITLLATEPNWIRPTTATLRYPMRTVPNLNKQQKPQTLFGDPNLTRILAGETLVGVVGG